MECAHEEAERIAEKLSGIDGVACVTRSWPKREAALPCICLQLAGEQGVQRWDDTEYLTALEYYVRIFARSAGEAGAIGGKVRPVMEALGYERRLIWEDAGEQTFTRIERYRTVI